MKPLLCYNQTMDRKYIIARKLRNNIKFYDLERTKYLESKGYKILRFWNNDIDTNIEGVLNEIVNCTYFHFITPNVLF